MTNGFALVDKPPDWTSHDVVGRLRRLYGQRKVGHAGTLDPMATGVLVVGLGHATRLLRFVQGAPKRYEATIRLGQSTSTDDAQGEIVSTPGWSLDEQALAGGLAALTGTIDQVPSTVSAVKVGGVRAYARARAGEQVDLAARTVTISRFEVVNPPRQNPPLVDVDVVVECSSGTYIRALARDLGQRLGTAGHLSALRRTAIGAVDVTQCAALGDEPPPVTPVEDLMRRILPVQQVDAATADALRNGRLPRLDAPDGVHLILAGDGRWVSVVDVTQGLPTILVNRPPDLSPR